MSWDRCFVVEADRAQVRWMCDESCSGDHSVQRPALRPTPHRCATADAVRARSGTDASDGQAGSMSRPLVVEAALVPPVELLAARSPAVPSRDTSSTPGQVDCICRQRAFGIMVCA
jgi:hypothetical protein